MPAALGSLTLRVPTGDEGRGLGAEDVDVGLMRDRDLDVWTAAGSVEYRATRAWSLVGEIVSGLGSDSAADTVVLRAGTTYSVTDRIRADAAIGVGATRESPDVLLTVGVTIVLF